MPLGTTAVSAKNLPTEAYVITPGAWAQTAKKNEDNIFTSQAPLGQAVPFTLPQVGIAAALLITLTAKLVVGATTSTITGGGRWPYGLLNTFNLGVNGQQNLFDVVGEDLRVRQDIAYPAFTEQVDVFPGLVGGGAIVAGTHPLSLSWWVPISTELVTLSGALYAQSPSTTIRCVLGTAAKTLAGLVDGALATITIETPKWTVTETYFVPAYDTKGRIICPPGIATLHAMTSVDLPLTAGQNSLLLVRGSGNLQRLLLSFQDSPTFRCSAAPNFTPTYAINSLILSYGGKQQPFIWTPAATLLRDNNRDYGNTPPYDYLVFDTLKQTPQRDAIYYPGLTTLKIIPFMGSSVSGTAHIVQEDLFQ